ncbi:deoxyribonuclease-1-like 1 isoform X1 [Clupea harengus]|uniref:Deoxyribonuclease-1-like 1 n=1 Tax=Clupea harengus TaxID=7950 RepID=A0A6P3VH75_CLUHA|nr:deoxyribonuclease-1-like 1 isoform X1 [Clupea harengus]
MMPVTANKSTGPWITLALFANVLCPLLAFKICAFNVQSFGDSKSADVPVMHTLIRILSRCDIALLQEVRDHKREAIPTLLAALNRYDSHHDYDFVASERLGRSSYQEQYVFVYRTDTVSVKDQYQYPDTQKGDVDAFAREPFVVWFRAPRTVLGEFVLIPQHTSPSNATKEIDELYDVFVAIKKKWRVENVMFLGDFNAACGYVAKKNRKNIRLYTDPSFIWLIGDDIDTTVRESTNCAYDRIIIHGENFARGIVPNSAGAFNFAEEYRLTEEQAEEVSDHYPVEVALRVRTPGLARQRGPLSPLVRNALKGPAALARRLIKGLIHTFYNSTVHNTTSV